MIRPAAILLAGVVLGAARLPLPPAPPPHTPGHGDPAHVDAAPVARSPVARPARVAGGVRAVAGARRLPLPPPRGRVRAGAEVVTDARSSLPVPPSPSAQVRARAGQLAPLPESILPEPVPAEGSKVNVRIFSLKEQQGGLAFIPGSAYAAPEDRKPMQTPEVTFSLPLR